MRKHILWVFVGIVAPTSFGQLLDNKVNYYAYGGISHTLILLGSDDARSGTGFSLAFGRAEPKLTIRKKLQGELIWEAYYNESRTNRTTVRYPSKTNQGYGIIATARYRWRWKDGINIYGDLGTGFQVFQHSSLDLPLANDSILEFGTGLEFRTSEKSAILFGSRYLHTSNAGRVRPNYGENLIEWYIGYRWNR